MTELIKVLTILLRLFSEGEKVGFTLELWDKLSKSPKLLGAFVRVVELSSEDTSSGEQPAPQEFTPTA